VDYRKLKRFVWPLLGIAVVLLVVVLATRKINGARRWLSFGPMRLQPSELAKLTLILVLAWYGERYQRLMPTLKRGILIPASFIGVVLALIVIEPDVGNTVLLAAVSGSMLLIAGVRWRFIIPPIIGGLAGLGLFLMHDTVRRARILSWLHPEDASSGVGYQTTQAKLALGVGGWWGLGLGNGRQKLGWVPEHHTDFILSVIGEELGLIATLLVVAAFIIIVLCGLNIALKAPDTFGLLLGCGLTFLIGFQAFINIGVVTSALPNKGLPLPFISYGGSNLLMMLACVGLLLSIARQSARGAAPELKTALDQTPLPEGSPA
jgi:cell division protein FtsW